MSRERVFEAWQARVAVVALGLIAVFTLQATAIALLGTRPDPAPITGPQTNNNLSPVFQCTGAGAQVVVSLGGDGKSVFVFCDDVKH